MGTYEKEERDGGVAKSGFGSGTKSESFNGRRVAAAGEVMRGGIVHRCPYSSLPPWCWKEGGRELVILARWMEKM